MSTDSYGCGHLSVSITYGCFLPSFTSNSSIGRNTEEKEPHVCAHEALIHLIYSHPRFKPIVLGNVFFDVAVRLVLHDPAFLSHLFEHPDPSLYRFHNGILPILIDIIPRFRENVINLFVKPDQAVELDPVIVRYQTNLIFMMFFKRLAFDIRAADDLGRQLVVSE